MSEIAATSRRNRLQFGLRTMLIAITAIAVGIWMIWIALPRWQDHRQRMRFEESIKVLKTGMTPIDVAKKVLRHHRLPSRITAGGPSGNSVVVFDKYDAPGAIYCIYYVLDRPSTGVWYPMSLPCKSVEVFRLKPAPPDYQPITEYGQYLVSHNRFKPEKTAEEAYVSDFMSFACGDRKNAAKFDLQLIYSDPPMLRPDGPPR